MLSSGGEGEDYMKSSQAILTKHCMIMEYCYRKNQLNSGVDPTENGQMEAIINFSNGGTIQQMH